MAREGKIPGLGKHGRKSEFMERCVKAVKAAYPRAETDASKLSYMDRAVIRCALGGSAPYEGCLNDDCLDKEPQWTAGSAGWKRCSYCNLLYSYKRTWESTRDLVRPALERLRQQALYEGMHLEAPRNKRRRLTDSATSGGSSEE